MLKEVNPISIGGYRLSMFWKTFHVAKCRRYLGFLLSSCFSHELICRLVVFAIECITGCHCIHVVYNAAIFSYTSYRSSHLSEVLKRPHVRYKKEKRDTHSFKNLSSVAVNICSSIVLAPQIISKRDLDRQQNYTEEIDDNSQRAGCIRARFS